MIVKSILDEKGRNIIKIMAHEPVKALIDTLADKKIGALIIHDSKDRLIGIASERDIVRALGKNGAEALEKPVSAIMTKNPSTCTENDTIETVMDQMTKGRFRHLPVVDGTEIVGMISIGDVVNAKIKQAETEKAQLIDYMTH